MKNYKFKSLNFYSDLHPLMGDKLKYRDVFEAGTINYLYAELTLYNKLFDEKEWDFKCDYKIFDLNTSQMTANFSKDMKVTTDMNEVVFRHGWGTGQPGYWKKGKYRWEAWIEGEKVGEKIFYILDKGLVTQTHNPYFNTSSMVVRLYEGPGDGVKSPRQTLSQFDTKKARYVWVEIETQNLLLDEAWPCEFFINFYFDTGEMRGQVQTIEHVALGSKQLTCLMGWGSEEPGRWLPDNYRVEIVFMDQLLAVIPFTVGESDIESPNEVFLAPFAKVSAPAHTGGEPLKENLLQSLEEITKQLNEMIGLGSVKKHIHEWTEYLKFTKLRSEKGLEDKQKPRLHMVLTGNPGTGKTTVARMLGKIYRCLGLLSRGHVVEVDRAELVGQYIGQTAPRTKKAIDSARGGIIFIDEAYSLTRVKDSTNDFGPEVIEVLLKEMSDGPGDVVIMAAGYPQEMKDFLESNPGLKSRFGEIIEFPDYTPEDLLAIAQYAAKKSSVSFEESGLKFLEKKLIEAYRDRDKNFGNARLVNGLVGEAKMKMGLRLMKEKKMEALTKEALSTITLQDVEEVFREQAGSTARIPLDDPLLTDSLKELKALTGLTQLKEEVEELVKLSKYYHEIGKSLHKALSFHSVFTGNPGTGKTTVACIMARLFRALGVLERGHLIECDREKLVGSYVGQTTQKTTALIEKASGGVLFIDEAYSLIGDQYGLEAIEILLKRMEDKRGDFAVIVAGYTKNMEQFLSANPGLQSRFDKKFHFPDYSSEELSTIAESILLKEGLTATFEAKDYLQQYIDKLRTAQSEHFGNAREIRKLITEAIKNQHLRMASLSPQERTSEMMKTLTIEDLAEFKLNEIGGIKKTIGFHT